MTTETNQAEIEIETVKAKRGRKPKPAKTETQNPEQPWPQHGIIQVVSGIHRGRTGQIGRVDNDGLMCYCIGMSKVPDFFKVTSAAAVFIGKGRVGWRGEFPEELQAAPNID